MAALFLAVAQGAQAAGHIGPAPIRPHGIGVGVAPRGVEPAAHARPWVEGVTPGLENRLFQATYRTLPSHNVLKVYVFDTGGFESAGIRFSARVPHAQRDLTRLELDREAVMLIRTTFERFPELQTLDVWATIPVATMQQTRVESTVFSVSADRDTYVRLRDGDLAALDDEQFLEAFGRVWTAPQVPQQ